MRPIQKQRVSNGSSKSDCHPPPKKETAAPVGAGSGGECEKADNLQSEDYTDSASEAMARMGSAIDAFNALTGQEQLLYVNRLSLLMREGEPIPVFVELGEEAENWAALAIADELEAYGRACLTRLGRDRRISTFAWMWRGFSRKDRLNFLVTVTGGHFRREAVQ